MTSSESNPIAIPLFPVKTVLFPQGLLSLKMITAPYAQLLNACITAQAPFGLVTVENLEQDDAQLQTLSKIGILAQINSPTLEKIAPQSAIECIGTQRFRYQNLIKSASGLWIAKDGCLICEDAPTAIPHTLQHCSELLRQLSIALIRQGKLKFANPYQFANAGWVANRWSEILPLNHHQKLELLNMVNPVERLTTISHYIQQAHLSN